MRRARPSEVHHASARAVVEGVRRGEDVLVVPSRFGIEVVASLARRGDPVAATEAYVDALLAPPAETITLGPIRAARVRRCTAALKLRAADACYVWTAQRRGLDLCSLDREMLARVTGVRCFAP